MDDLKNGMKAYQNAAMILAAKRFSAEEAQKNNEEIAAKNEEKTKKAILELKNSAKKTQNSPKTAKNDISARFKPINIAKDSLITEEFRQKLAENPKILAKKADVPQKKPKKSEKKAENPSKKPNVPPKNPKNDFQSPQFSGFVRAAQSDAPKIGGENLSASESPIRQVAKFLVLIGSEAAAKVFPLLPADKIDEIAHEIATIRTIGKEEAAKILAKFGAIAQKAAESGGIATAKNILTKAFGEEKAKSVLKKTKIGEKNPFEAISALSEEKISVLLQNESASLKAIALSQILPQKAAKVINLMKSDEKADIIRRLAALRDIDSRVLARIGGTLNEKSRSLVENSEQKIDGRAVLSEILRKMPGEAESKLLESIGIDDSELENDLRERLFTLDDIPKVDDKFIQKTLSEMDDEKIALVIARKSADFREKILKNVSQRRRDAILDEENARKPIKKSEVAAATEEFFSVAKAARESGNLRVEGLGGEIWV